MVDQAEDGTDEKTSEPSNMGLTANRIGYIPMHARVLSKAMNRYVTSHAESVGYIKSLMQVLNDAYGARGDKLFTSQARKARQPHGHNCLVEKAKLDEKTKKAEGTWSDSDSDSDFDEVGCVSASLWKMGWCRPFLRF